MQRKETEEKTAHTRAFENRSVSLLCLASENKSGDVHEDADIESTDKSCWGVTRMMHHQNGLTHHHMYVSTGVMRPRNDMELGRACG